LLLITREKAVKECREKDPGLLRSFISPPGSCILMPYLHPESCSPRTIVIRDFSALFDPACVAVIGASDNPGKLGYHVMKSLTSGGFKGVVLPVNPGADQIFGIKAFPSISSFPGAIDLAVVVLPSAAVPDLFRECVQKGVKSIVLITAGFKEIEDPRGAELQNDLARIANEAGIPVIGPNTFGIVNLSRNLNASFTPEFSLVRPGGVSLVSQSGGISHLMGFLAMREGLRISKIVGLGNRLNVDFPEMVEYLLEDADTKVIMLYLEGVDDGRRLVERIGWKKGIKPIIAYKSGRAGTSDRASMSHTGSLAGRHDIYKGALRQAGILPLESTEDLFDAARALAGCPLPKGRRVGVLSGQAGPGMAACDLCEEGGLEIVSFSPGTQDIINKLLPPLALRTNPVDMGPAWYNAEAVAGILKAVLEDERVDAVVLLMMFASANREAVPGIARLFREWKPAKPLITCLLSPPGIWDEQVMEMEESGVLVNYSTPERAARAMAALWQYRKIVGGV
jgi:acyl-CoA synthetase (NDP forming)